MQQKKKLISKKKILSVLTLDHNAIRDAKWVTSERNLEGFTDTNGARSGAVG